MILYRGITSDHVQYQQALNGEIKPKGGDASPYDHNEGNTDSIYTSWTTDIDTAKQFTDEAGLILVLEIDAESSKLVKSTDRYNELEVLVMGPVKDFSILRVQEL